MTTKTVATHPAVATIERMDRRGTLEVEHVLALVKSPVPLVADELDDLSAREKWSHSGRSGGRRIVPFALWAEVVSAYCRGGYRALGALAADRTRTGFVTAVAKTIADEAAVQFLLKTYAAELRDPTVGVGVAHDVVCAFNLILFKNRIAVAPRVATRVRAAAHALLAAAPRDDERATALCALRWVGDAKSLALMEATRIRSPIWASAQPNCVRLLRKRLASAPPGPARPPRPRST